MCPKWSLFAPSPSSIPLKAKLELSAKQGRYSLGDQPSGQVTITSEEEFLVKQLNVFLKCEENIKKTRTTPTQYGPVQKEYWDSACIYNCSFRIFANVRIPAGFSCAYSYTLDVSPAARETLYSIDHNVKWHLFALLEPVNRPNMQTPIYEIQVLRPRASQSQPAVVKEVTREIVLIPCAYCSGLMPQTSLFCPNCGAKRKS